VESAVAETLEGVNARDRAATRRVLEQLASHLGSGGSAREHALRPRQATQAGREKGDRPYA
jgi:hypothetical protein